MNSPEVYGNPVRLLIAVFSCLLACAGVASGQSGPPLKIVVIQGQGLRNNVALGTTQQLVVQVRDESDKPVPGASVTFYTPERGPGGAFFGAYNKLTVSANEQGTAAATNFQPNLFEGSFQIRVIATLENRTGDAVINQTNFLETSVLPGESA